MPLEIVDALANIPHITFSCYYIAKACDARKKGLFIALAEILSFGIVVLNNYNIVNKNIRVGFALLVLVFGVVPFAGREKAKSVIFCGLNYLVLEVCEMLATIVIWSIYGVEELVYLNKLDKMLFSKIVALCITIPSVHVLYMIWNRISVKTKVNSNRTLFFVFIELFFVIITLFLVIKEGRVSTGIITILAVLISIALNTIAFYLMEQTDKKNQEELKGRLLELQVENQGERKRELDADLEKAADLKSYIAARIDEAMEFLRGGGRGTGSSPVP